MQIDELKQLKAQALERLREQIRLHVPLLESIDHRLTSYFEGVAQNEPDTHNLYEILGCLRWLRLADTYEVDTQVMYSIFRIIEGEWRDGRWVPGSGGLAFDGMSGVTHYRLTRFQVWAFTSLFALYCWVPTDKDPQEPDLQLLPSEMINPDDGIIYDRRRLCTDFIFFSPRKVGKTWFAAVVDILIFMLLGDYNAEIAMCANAESQSKILFTKFKELLRNLDPRGMRIRMTATEVNWKPFQIRACTATAYSAGGKTKDGFFAQVVNGDEYGSAAYVKGRCDMSNLMNVMCSSMGPRREPLRLITTTAGHAIQGPFQNELEGVKQLLENEMNYETA